MSAQKSFNFQPPTIWNVLKVVCCQKWSLWDSNQVLRLRLNYNTKEIDAIERCSIICSRSINSIYYRPIFVLVHDDNLFEMTNTIRLGYKYIFWMIKIAFKVHFISNKVLSSMCENFKITRWQLVRQQLSSNYEKKCYPK